MGEVPPDQKGRCDRQFPSDPAIGNNIGRARSWGPKRSIAYSGLLEAYERPRASREWQRQGVSCRFLTRCPRPWARSALASGGPLRGWPSPLPRSAYQASRSASTARSCLVPSRRVTEISNVRSWASSCLIVRVATNSGSRPAAPLEKSGAGQLQFGGQLVFERFPTSE